MREGPRSGRRLGEAAMPMVGARRTAIAVVTERDEWTGRGPVHAGQPSLSHRRDDTRLGTAGNQYVRPKVPLTIAHPEA